MVPFVTRAPNIKNISCWKIAPKPLVHIDPRIRLNYYTFIPGKTILNWIERYFSTLFHPETTYSTHKEDFFLARYRSPNGPHLLRMAQPITSPENPGTTVVSFGHLTPWPENPGYRTQVWDKQGYPLSKTAKISLTSIWHVYSIHNNKNIILYFI